MYLTSLITETSVKTFGTPDTIERYEGWLHCWYETAEQLRKSFEDEGLANSELEVRHIIWDTYLVMSFNDQLIIQGNPDVRSASDETATRESR